MSKSLLQQFGNIDIYLFDQILKGRLEQRRSVLDAGCGSGRNLVYLLRQGFDVYGIDQDPDAIQQVQALCREIAPAPRPENFILSNIEEMPFEENRFDLVIVNAVLHFAKNPDHFDKMLTALWKVLKPGGLFFTRLASTIGLEDRLEPLGQQRYLLPDGTERYLVTQEELLQITERLPARLAEPIKTTNVQNLRAMTTWVLEKE